MDQEIRFLTVDGKRVAYATLGSGPPLVLASWWISHLELDWGTPSLRRFLTALAGAGRTVIRYNPIGTGLSEREWTADDLAVDAEVRVLDAIVERTGAEPVDLLGISGGGATAIAYAADRPERVAGLTLWGAYAHGAAIAPAEVRRSMVDVVRSHWGLGARVLADVFVAGAETDEREAFARYQRGAAGAEAAAARLEASYACDVRDVLGDVRTPALVVHRRDDRAVPYALSVELAAALPDARLVTLEGFAHLPWLGDSDAALRTLGVGAVEPVTADDTGDLSDRELEVLRLVASGLSDAEIAERLYLSPHTVHRHVANIRTKLEQPSRAAAVAHAARLGLI
jgi:pimeloyl-ACP methyl ester carboxylesterase/DNA-binding CsgD family transcriptional regulator